MANDLILGKLRFDMTVLDNQLKTVTEKLNTVKELAAQAQKVSSGGSKGSRSSSAGEAAALGQIATMAKTAHESVKALSSQYTKMGQAGATAAKSISTEMGKVNSQVQKTSLASASAELRR